MLFETVKTAAWLTLLCLPMSIYAQRDTSQFDLATSPNITLRFFQTSQDDTCSYYNSTDALTFTTIDIPRTQPSFNIPDLFGGNATQGFVNESQSSNFVSGVHWQLFNKEKYDTQANYSSMLHRHYNWAAQEKERQPGHDGRLRLNFYAGLDCRTLDEPSFTDYPWYSSTCWSEEYGNCGTLPYNITSFLMFRTDPEERDGSCMGFAEYGAASGTLKPFQAALSAVFVAALAVWLPL